MEKNQELYQEEQRQLLLDLNKGMSLLSVKLQEQIDAYEVPVKSLEVSGEVKVNTEKTIEVSNLTELQEAINSLETTLSTAIVENSYKPVDKVSVSNIKEAMPKDLAITNLAELKKYFDSIGQAIKANQPIIEVQKQNVVFPTSAGQPVSVRLSDGKSFYKAVAAIASAGLSKLAETNLESLLFDGSGNLKVTSTGGSATSSNISNDLFGSAMTATNFNQIEIDFSSTAAHLLTELTTTATSGGSASLANGQATLTTGANTNGGFKAVSNLSTEYRPMSETYAAFSTIFTAGLANSYQRIGLYNTNNGFFIGFEGTSFGVTKRTSGADTTIAQASFSEDTLTGVSTSTFTRNGTPEALDITKDNLYRIRFGWLGAAPIYFEVFSPDGEWVVFHKIKHPNSSTLPSIAEPNLPITMDIKKTTGGATVLNISTACWAAGTTAPPSAEETKYGISDIEATATYKYFGFQKGNQYWYIMRKTIATKKFEYVAGASAYATAWTNRATQTYTDYATAF
jgi:sulfur carrier protein ThiS